MAFDKNILKLYAITDRHGESPEDLAKKVELAIKGGATCIQLREKHVSYDEMKSVAVEVQKVCRKYNVPFIVNDNVALAKEINADGVHVGQSDAAAVEARKILGSNAIVGVTAKTIDQARLAQEQGADYLGSGAVFGSSTKLDAKSMTYETLCSICESVTIPVVAIGGITSENILGLKGSKIAGAAIVSGIFSKDDITAAAADLKSKINSII